MEKNIKMLRETDKKCLDTTSPNRNRQVILVSTGPDSKTILLGCVITCVIKNYCCLGVCRATPAHRTRPMLSVVRAGIGGMDRLVGSAEEDAEFERALAIERERQIRLRSVQNDFKLNLPHSISISDESPFRSNFKSIEMVLEPLITAPPNRTVYEAESPPPYRPLKGLKSSTSTSTTFHQNQPPLLQSTFTASSSSLLSCPMTSNYYSTVSNNAALTTSTTISNESIQSCSARSGLISLPSNSSTSSNLISSTTSSLSSSSSSSNSNYFNTNNGNKTDFLQKTVKILTGKKNQSLSPSRSPNLSTSLPVNLVPNKTKRIPNESLQQQQQAQAQSQYTCSCCLDQYYLSYNSAGPSHMCKCTGVIDSPNRQT